MSLAVLVALGLSVACSLPTPLPTPPPTVPDDVAPDSPRASLTRFFGLCRAENYDEAARYLDLSVEQLKDGATLARHLKAVLDHDLGIEPDDVSPLPNGEPNAGLPQGVLNLGTIRLGSRAEPVRLVKRDMPEGARWLFSRNTVDRVDRWYDELGDHWIRDRLPAELLQSGPFGVLWWQWIALPVSLILSFFGGKLLSHLTQVALLPVLRRIADPWGTNWLLRLDGPATLAYALLLASILLRRVALPIAAEEVLLRVFRAGEIVVLFGAFLRTIDVFTEVLASRVGDPGGRSLLAVLSRAGKVAAVLLLAVSLLAAFEVPVASVLAGIGIGGLGLALAAQKTVENLFGSFSLVADRAVRVGDTIQIDQITGTVESVGLRSTRIRTPERTVVAIPNGRLADLRIESLTARDRLRLACVLPLVFGTKADQVRRILRGIEAALRAQPKLSTQDLVVCLKEVGPSSLNIEVNALFEANLDEFRRIREEVLLLFLEVVEREGSALALPSQTLYVSTGERKDKV